MATSKKLQSFNGLGEPVSRTGGFLDVFEGLVSKKEPEGSVSLMQVKLNIAVDLSTCMSKSTLLVIYIFLDAAAAADSVFRCSFEPFVLRSLLV